LNRLRVQIGGALFFAVLLPALALRLRLPASSDEPIIAQSFFGLIFAVGFSVYLLRNIGQFPGMRRGYFILPSVLAGYALLFSIFLFLRLDYSRPLFLASFVVCCAWLYLVHFLGLRSDAARIGIVPFGDISAIDQIPGIAWAHLSKPELAERCDMLVADLRADLPAEWEAFVAECALKGIAVFHVKQLREALTGRVAIEHISENNFGSLVPFMAYLRFRRLIDLISAVVIGALLLPFLVIVGFFIRMDSPGPALFRQSRIGFRGEPFTVVKFRTMVESDESDSHHDVITTDGDKRVTRLGAFLRRSRIDELPQIWNILKGEMSWIGPRPEAEILSRWFATQLPFYPYRHIVPPGITGWAQVNQGYATAELDDETVKLHYDFYYIKNFSPWLDALIVVKTIQTMLTGSGAR
jgi:lipopolysaccharide/colanic/teichoic acid biosynthesis glycosyltransferase